MKVGLGHILADETQTGLSCVFFTGLRTVPHCGTGPGARRATQAACCAQEPAGWSPLQLSPRLHVVAVGVCVCDRRGKAQPGAELVVAVSSSCGLPNKRR